MEDTNLHEGERVAPGGLRLVHEFLLAIADAPTEEEVAFADAVRRRRAEGEAQATIASEAGIPQRLVSAIVREKRLTRPRGSADGLAEGLFSEAAAEAWLSRRGLIEPGAVVSADDVKRLRELREALVELTLANNLQPASQTAEARLERLAGDSPLRLRFAAGGAAIEPAADDAVGGAIGHLLVLVAGAMWDGTWPRLKTCPADRCLASFYDASRNRTRTWCDMAICGNREKVRSYQERRRTKAAAN